MSDTIMIILHFIATSIFSYLLFQLIQRMLSETPISFWLKLIISVLNAGIVVLSDLYLSLSLAYLIAIIVIYTQAKIIFKKPLSNTLYVVCATLVNIMSIRDLVLVSYAWINSSTLLHVINSNSMYLKVVLYGNIIEIIAVFLLIIHFVPTQKIRTAMQINIQRWYLLAWMGICVLFLFINTGIYKSNFVNYSIFLLEICFCLCLLTSCYLILFYTFHINSFIKKIKKLAFRLSTKERLQNAIMKDAIITTQGNLTKNTIIYIYPDYLNHFQNNYDLCYKYAENLVHPEDREVFSSSLNRTTLLENYRNCIQPDSFEYRLMGEDGKYHWINQFLRIFQDTETNDVYLFGYGFNIDDDILQHQELKHRAQIDSFTGLFNKATTEKYISQKIASGCGSLFLLDIDCFKNINDTYGHRVGDKIIMLIVDALRETFRKSDIIGRVGGDEFMVYVESITDKTNLSCKAKELMENIETISYNSQYKVTPTVSIGIVAVYNRIDDFTKAYKKADTALYSIKETTKNNYAIYSDDMI